MKLHTGAVQTAWQLALQTGSIVSTSRHCSSDDSSGTDGSGGQAATAVATSAASRSII
jgi:hypothetical protein